jgi:Na+-translocating ferredoxin:NAD+ oxidoreductase RnfC subunit
MKPIIITNEQNIKPISTVTEYLKPDKIYLKLPDLKHLLVKNGESILKEQIVYQDNKNVITSPVSGIVDKNVLIDNINYLIINNDYKESNQNLGHARNLGKMSKANFLNALNDLALNTIFSGEIDNLYINAIDIDPYCFNKYAYLKNNMTKVLDLLKNISNILNINKIIIIITSNYQDLLDDYTKIISDYNKIAIKTMPNFYPIGNSVVLKNVLKLNNHDVLIDLNDIIKIDYQVRRNRSVSEVYLTINGNLLNGQVFKVKRGTFLPVILNQMHIKNSKIVLNNSLCGKVIDENKTVIDDNIKCLILNKEIAYDEELCSNCGLCYEVCPIKINPLIKNDKCLKCGLCNYTCPAKINIVERFQEK